MRNNYIKVTQKYIKVTRNKYLIEHKVRRYPRLASFIVHVCARKSKQNSK